MAGSQRSLTRTGIQAVEGNGLSGLIGAGIQAVGAGDIFRNVGKNRWLGVAMTPKGG